VGFDLAVMPGKKSFRVEGKLHARRVKKRVFSFAFGFGISGLRPVPRTAGRGFIINASTHSPLRARRSGYVYKKGCDIGECMRDGYWGDEP
jgi:hypothetical protein